MSDFFDPMTRSWPIYEKPLREHLAKIDLPAAKMKFVLLVTRDAYLRSAPSLVELPDCPPLILDYIFDLTYRLLAQIAKGAAANYDMSAAAGDAWSALLESTESERGGSQ